MSNQITRKSSKKQNFQNGRITQKSEKNIAFSHHNLPAERFELWTTLEVAQFSNHLNVWGDDTL
jgi:hypothetical protein